MAAPIQFAQVGVQPQIVYQQPQVASQQQQVFPQKKRFPGEDQCKLFVGGLNYDTRDEDFTKYFEEFGEVIDSIIMIDKNTGKPRGFGFVTYKSEEDMEKCLAHEGPHILDDRRLQVRKYYPKEQYQPEKVRAAGETFGNSQFKGPMKIPSELKIFVGGIAPGTDESDVEKYFQDFGTVVDVNLPKDHLTHNYRGFGFVGFETTEVVAAVTKNRYHQINGKTVEVKGCDEQDRYHKQKRDTGNRYGDQQQQRIQSVVPAVQSALPQAALYQAAQAQALQYQLAGLGATAATPTAAGAGYTVIPAGYSYDPTTGMIYQAAVPAQPQLATSGQQVTSQQQLIQYLQQQQQLAGLQMAGQQYAIAAPGSAGAASVAQAAPAYQQISLGQYSQESSAFGAQRILQAAAGGATTQLTTADSAIYQPAASAADQNAAAIYAATNPAGSDQRSTSRSTFHPYGR